MIEIDKQNPKNTILLLMLAVSLAGIAIFGISLNRRDTKPPEPTYTQDEAISEYSGIFQIKVLDDNVVSISANEGYRDGAIRHFIDSGSNPADYKITFTDYRNPFNDYE